MSFGSFREGVNDLLSKFIINQGCSDVRVMFDSGIPQDGAIDKDCAGNWGRYRFGSGFGVQKTRRFSKVYMGLFRVTTAIPLTT